MSDERYGTWILFVSMWSCLGCRRMYAGRDPQCPHCMSPRDPDSFLH